MWCPELCIFYPLFWSVQRIVGITSMTLYSELLLMMKIPLAFLGILITGWLIVHLQSTQSFYVFKMRCCQIMTPSSLVLLVGFLYLSGGFYFMLMAWACCFHQSRFSQLWWCQSSNTWAINSALHWMQIW